MRSFFDGSRNNQLWLTTVHYCSNMPLTLCIAKNAGVTAIISWLVLKLIFQSLKLLQKMDSFATVTHAHYHMKYLHE